MKTLWIFGHSSCLPTGIEHDLGWPALLKKRLDNIEIKNYAEEGVDNFYIYYKLDRYLDQIKPDDIVIIGWCHFSRKIFVLNRDNPIHQQQITQGSKIYPGDPEFFRSTGIKPDSVDKWLNMQPENQGNVYFDRWFNDYYSDIESEVNFSAYLSAARTKIPGRYLPFYFSANSIKNQCIGHQNLFCWLDFVIEHAVAISADDYHPNQKGHALLADIFFNMLTTI